MKTQVLVTGANSQLAQTLKAKHKNAQNNIAFHFLSKQDLDITNTTQIKTAFSKNHYDFCINCAAYTNVEQAENEPKKAFLVNAEAVKDLAKVCKTHSTTLIHISTDYVFDGTKAKPYLETDTTNPINVYGASKLKGEHYIKELLEKHYILRTSWLYSKTFGNNFYKTIINVLDSDKNISVITNQFGKPTSCEELVSYIEKILNNTKKFPFGTYHACGSKTMSWFDFAKAIAKEIVPEKIKLVQPTEYFPQKAKRPLNSVLSTQKIDSYMADNKIL